MSEILRNSVIDHCYPILRFVDDMTVKLNNSKQKHFSHPVVTQIENHFGSTNKEICFLGDSGWFVFAADWPKMTTVEAWGETG